MYGDEIHLTIAHKREWPYGFKTDNKTVPPGVIRSHRMTTNEKVARRKLSLLELTKELSNVSRACKIMGYSRQQFYEIRRNYQTLALKVSAAGQVAWPQRTSSQPGGPRNRTGHTRFLPGSQRMGRYGFPWSWPCRVSLSAPAVSAVCGNATIYCPA